MTKDEALTLALELKAAWMVYGRQCFKESAAELRRLHEVNETALRLLKKIFDAYEDGVPCNEDDGQDSFIGNAVNLGTAADKEIIDFLEKYSPSAAITKAEAK